ncbi:4-carboxy-4-hydroxy-2-oxoadipate aldolase/oxaloacetate decarboxylase [Xylophilus sp.]|uniref:4-carboxy-4-hydroxy-2-oxoadipate aldolase/oxaloacetate decarboxylase n=1 Tax=Xylophilus sp. TaxID=2653893 RepID=UPI0013BE18EF|nr:4-carboxy-4-hydroxy-2-oxoadipate aldolase/oxaloacetate decarboxylase [Xylophilus sp.]KAF1049138.1 MAG: 4-hydroxy-4-methyl-2-oxoglutarate aldolase/4-carboxy-4-hydroxy-2-oxoadipate aldolase [Xylophilus sp.]
MSQENLSFDDILARLRDFGAATVYEAQGAFGALDGGIKPLDAASRIAGPAFTVDARPADNLVLHLAVQKARPGDVLVVDAKGCLEAGPWGDILTLQAQHKGIAALVIDGCVRDAAAIVASGFPVFCRGLSIKGTGKNQPGRLGMPLSLGGAVVRPGDIVVGDRDGLVIVPREQAASAVEKSQAREQKEQAQREAILRGTSTVELLGLQTALDRLGMA